MRPACVCVLDILRGSLPKAQRFHDDHRAGQTCTPHLYMHTHTHIYIYIYI